MQHEMRVVSLALVACEKSVQIVYERNLRPAAVQFEPWMEFVKYPPTGPGVKATGDQ